MARGIAFLAGLGAGYAEQGRRNKEDERQDKRDKREQELHDARMREVTRAEDDRKALREAAAPAEVVNEPMVGPTEDGGAMAGTNPRVGAQHFASAGVAQAEADKQNTPEGRRSRVQSALAQQDPLKAEQFRQATTQGDAAALQLQQMVQKAKDEGSDRALQIALNGGSGADIEAAFNQRGEQKISNVQVQPFDTEHPVLGKQRSARITGVKADGTPFEVPDALAMHFSFFQAEKRLDALFKAKDDKRADKQLDANIEHQKTMEGIAQQQANTQEKWRRDQAALMEQHYRNVAAGKAKPGEPLQVTLKDKRDFESDLAGFIKEQFPIKDATDAAERTAVASQRDAYVARGQTVFHDNATLGIPLTAGTVLQAMQLASNRANIKPFQAPNGTTYGAVVVNGQPVVVTGPLQQRGAAPTTPAANAAAGVSPQDARAMQTVNDASAMSGTAMTPGVVDPNAYRSR
jgi:hypothetical protein